MTVEIPSHSVKQREGEEQRALVGRRRSARGLDHERLSYDHNGIERRLADVHGEVIQDVLV